MSLALDIAARTIWQEARGEPELGQRAVANVIVNRMKDGRWGPNLATVCLWPKQFSGWNGPHDPNFIAALSLSDDDPLLAKFARFLDDALSGAQDPTQGALFYYAETSPTPGWVALMKHHGKVGHHLFFTDK